MNKEKILEEIALLKATKPEGWKRSVHTLIRGLVKLEDLYNEHEDHGSDQRGRRIHRMDGCPAYDRHGDNSRP